MVPKRRLNYVAFTCQCKRVVKLRRRMSQWRVNRVVLCTGQLLHGHVRSYPPFKRHQRSVRCTGRSILEENGIRQIHTLSCGRSDRRAIPHPKDARHKRLAEAVETWKLMNDKVQLLNAS